MVVVIAVIAATAYPHFEEPSTSVSKKATVITPIGIRLDRPPLKYEKINSHPKAPPFDAI